MKTRQYYCFGFLIVSFYFRIAEVCEPAVRVGRRQARCLAATTKPPFPYCVSAAQTAPNYSTVQPMQRILSYVGRSEIRSRTPRRHGRLSKVAHLQLTRTKDITRLYLVLPHRRSGDRKPFCKELKACLRGMSRLIRILTLVFPIFLWRIRDPAREIRSAIQG